MRRPFFSLAPVALLGLVLLLPAPAAEGAKATKSTKKSRSARPTPTPAPTPAPTPTPTRYLRAAGSCMEFTPGQHLVVAEVGSTGRVFRVDGETRIETDVKRGVRLRVLYVDTPEGPVARRILPGPVASPKSTPPP
ncbi:MAG: hypothetical protein KJ062_12025 [Thermoanaerobaculia bacterium]|nr:hypothetical protein [Thermoanaerobaculia bacterium]